MNSEEEAIQIVVTGHIQTEMGWRRNSAKTKTFKKVLHKLF